MLELLSKELEYLIIYSKFKTNKKLKKLHEDCIELWDDLNKIFSTDPEVKRNIAHIYNISALYLIKPISLLPYQQLIFYKYKKSNIIKEYFL
jgi:hypothetical protein